MTAESMLSKRVVLRITAALFVLLKLSQTMLLTNHLLLNRLRLMNHLQYLQYKHAKYFYINNKYWKNWNN